MRSNLNKIAPTSPLQGVLACLLVLSFPLSLSADNFDPQRDYHSFSNPHEILSTHLDLDLSLNFTKQVIEGSVTLTLKHLQSSANELILDTRDLTIKKVTAVSSDPNQTLRFRQGKQDPYLGSPLYVNVPEGTRQIKIEYLTSPRASGLQWLSPAQTSGKKQPFVFTQAQAIHARSFIPLQDTPQVRTSYTATIHTPKALRAIMAAQHENSIQRDGLYTFTMPQPVPSYLIAFAAGDIDFKAMGERTGVYAEPSLLDAAAAEFADTEAMLEATEAKFGPYGWRRYDLLILPPSFPFGGMENPRLSFITPTVIAGDKSLVALIAHELAHSWSGNSVTNATWRDLWLNEGFTTYLTYRIMEIIYGKRRYQMESALGYQSLVKDMERLPIVDQPLAVDLRDRDPDDAFSEIPYEKGALMLLEIEQAIGRPSFDQFLHRYFAEFKFQSLTTESFLDYANTQLVKRHPKKLSMARLHEWIYQPGLPQNAPQPQSDAFDFVDEKRQQWLDGKLLAKRLNKQAWTVHEWLHFLNNMPQRLSEFQLEELDRAFDFNRASNNEIAHAWFLICIRNDYQPAFKPLEEYLVGIGRRKLIVPLYRELVKTEKGANFARRIYETARPGYHPMAQGTVDDIVKVNY